ncbi:SDR family oxidoreductase [Pseudaeromonas paramecii]|uniref:SDR family oxidoreductase n=1 Tax=Pseudaeromonas paramecii TaxID=2138166 RepID=A0ABP8QJ28_9GAMM
MNILILGASSAIAQAVIDGYVQRGATLLLVARDEHKLRHIADDARIRGAQQVETLCLDAATQGASQQLEHWLETLGLPLDLALLAYGSLPDQAECQTDLARLAQAIEVNFTSAALLCSLLANRMAARGSGTLAVISSVAGDRGRQSNYAYGAAKGGLSLFLQGLRNRLHRHGVKVLTIKPGFVDTPMTAQFDKGALWAQPQQVARGIIKAVDRGQDVVYLPGFWRAIMWVIRLIPETLFKRLAL